MSKHVEIIDHSKELDAIKKEFGEHFYRDDKATLKAAELWGAPTNGISGVFKQVTTEAIDNLKRCSAEIHFANTYKGYWLTGLSVSTGLCGYGHYPNVWQTKGYTSYEDARLAEILTLCEFFKSSLNDPIASISHKAEISRALTILEAEKTPQLNLF